MRKLTLLGAAMVAAISFAPASQAAIIYAGNFSGN